jgi:hypothetical protein
MQIFPFEKMLRVRVVKKMKRSICFISTVTYRMWVKMGLAGRALWDMANIWFGIEKNK